MDFLFSLTLAKYEAYFLAINAFLLVFYTGTWMVEKAIILFHIVFGKTQSVQIPPVETAVTPEVTQSSKESKTKKDSQKKAETPEEVPTSKWDEPQGKWLSNEEKQNLSEMAKIVKTKIARGEFSDAKSKIIEWLAIDKFDKELNCLLASLYERDQDYRRAELVYKDLVIVHETDPELYTKLGFSLSMQGKYEIAFEIYKKLLTLDKTSADEANEMLANLAWELGRHEEARDFAKAYLKNHPRNSDMLSLLASSHSALGEKAEALAALEKLKVIEPYNTKIRDLAEKIRLEIELAGSFASPVQESTTQTEAVTAPTTEEKETAPTVEA